jgi:hypothetical protein
MRTIVLAGIMFLMLATGSMNSIARKVVRCRVPTSIFIFPYVFFHSSYVSLTIVWFRNRCPCTQQNESFSVGLHGSWKNFEKPFFQTLQMFLGEVICLGIFILSRMVERRSSRQQRRLVSETSSLLEMGRGWVKSQEVSKKQHGYGFPR